MKRFPVLDTRSLVFIIVDTVITTQCILVLQVIVAIKV